MLTIVIVALIAGHNSAFAQAAKRFDVVITEVFCDPSPSVGLPNSEFIEVKNVSSVTINMKDWKISDGMSSATISVSYLLPPDSFAIICPQSSVAAYSRLGNAVGVSGFPSLDNDEDLVVLRSREGIIIHAIHYTKEWLQNDLKSEGGWTLEIIDPKNPCTGALNWKASTNLNGGTPGKKNSADGNNKDDTGPSLLRTYALDSTTIVAVFDEPVDNLASTVPSKYKLDKDPLHAVAASPNHPLFTEVSIKFPRGLSPSTVYNLTVADIPDCAGNDIGAKNYSKAGIASPADTFEVIINEILFNPKSDGYDYIEIYNRSKKIIDLQDLYVANRNMAGSLTNIHRLSLQHYLFFPGDHILVTENKRWLNQNYTIRDMNSLVELKSFVSLPDDKGTVALVNAQGTIIDELSYEAKWHFALITDDEGISLERIDYNQSTQSKYNWTSAASTAGYGTPGYQNSQFKADQQMQGIISVVPKLFSPDNDGQDDLATIQYQMSGTGYVANITIFDSNGRPVRYLAKNMTLGLQGNIKWDGLDDRLQKLPMGIYVVFTEVFNLQGKTKKFKNALTLARRF